MSIHKASFMGSEQAPWIPRQIQSRQVLKSWKEDEVTAYLRFNGAPWNETYLDINNIDAKWCPDDTQTISSSTYSSYITWDITVTAEKWLAGEPNYGILLSVSDEHQMGCDIRFYGRKQPQSPYLEVVYR